LEDIEENHGDVGFWFFYKDAVKTHFKNVFTTFLESKPFIEGLKLISTVLFILIADMIHIVLLITSIIWIPLIHIYSAEKASKIYREYYTEED